MSFTTLPPKLSNRPEKYVTDEVLGYMLNPADLPDGTLAPKMEALVREHGGRWRPRNPKELVDLVQVLGETWRSADDDFRGSTPDPEQGEMFYLSRTVLNLAHEARETLELKDVTISRQMVPTEHGIIGWFEPGIWIQAATVDIEDDYLIVDFVSVLVVSSNSPFCLPHMALKVKLGATADTFELIDPVPSETKTYMREVFRLVLTMFLFIMDPETFVQHASKVRVATDAMRAPKGAQRHSQTFSADGLRTVRTVSLTKHAQSCNNVSGETNSGSVRGMGGSHSYIYAVKGHWRNQWYGSLGVHAPKYIPMHFRGKKSARTLAVVKKL